MVLDKITDYSRLIRNRLTPRHPFIENYSLKRYRACLHQESNNLHRSNFSSLSRFVIFNFPRTGSNFLCSMLNQHPEILCHHELFNPTRIYYSKDFQELYRADLTYSREDLIQGKAGLACISERDSYPEKFIFEIWRNNFLAKSVGFNLFPNHIPNTALSLVSDPGVKKILLIRRNRLRAYVSLLLARKTSAWDFYSFDNSYKNRSKDSKFFVDPKQFSRWCLGYDKFFETIENKCIETGQPYMRILYEDLTSDQDTQCKADLLGFLEVSIRTDCLIPKTQKQNKRDLKDIITNISEIEFRNWL